MDRDDRYGTAHQCEQTVQELRANETTPVIGVHVLSQFVFCPRAGIITWETSQEDDGRGFVAAPSLGWPPLFEEHRIRAELATVVNRLRLTGYVALGISALVLILYLMSQELLAGGVAVLSMILVPWLARELRYFAWLRKRLSLARRATAAEPNWETAIEQEVNWWQLLRADWTSVEKQEALFDATIRLRGKPWRVLQKGSLHIPVFRQRGDSKKLHASHYARLAAYAYLIHSCERAQVPWAIVMFGRGDQGVAVPMRPESWKAFRQGLPRARQHVVALQASWAERPSPPEGLRPCVKCPLGQPRKFQRRIRFGETEAKPYLTEDTNGVVYHSICGDRFSWVPPHEKARALGLTD